MGWARLDDGFYDHQKVTALLEEEPDHGWAAIGFWTACLAWAHKHTRRPGKTPGHLPRSTVTRMDHTRGALYAGLLVKAGLWTLDSEGNGWHIHDFAQYLPSEKVTAVRAEAGRKGGLAKAANRSSQLEQASSELDSSSKPLANLLDTPLANAGSGKGSRSSSVVVSSGGARRATRLPKDFTVTPEMVAWARQRVPHVNGKLETEKFTNYWTAKSGQAATKVDWVATWRNWMLEAGERNGKQPGLPGVAAVDEWKYTGR